MYACIKKFKLTAVLCFMVACTHAQVVLPPGTPEHGFLPGKKFKFYRTINTYDFKNLALRIELFDDRRTLNLSQIDCSKVPFTNTSECEKPDFIYLFRQYIDTLFTQAKVNVNASSHDVVEIRLQGLDARLNGIVYVRVHGLCQLQIKYHGKSTIYCTDITDADEHSPVGPNALVTRKTATRIMLSASIRETIEQFFEDLKKQYP